MATLEDQLRAQWGGDWNINGIDRAAELARLLQGNGINDLSAINWTPGNQTLNIPQYGSAGRESWDNGAPTNATNFPSLQLNGLGWLGSVNNDDSLAGVGTSADKPYAVDIGNGAYDLGWSAKGHGNVTYTAQQGPDGQYHFVPVWGSSNDMKDVRTGAKMIATALGGMYGGDWVDALGSMMGGASAGAGSGLGAAGAEIGGSLGGAVGSSIAGGLDAAAVGAGAGAAGGTLAGSGGGGVGTIGGGNYGVTSLGSGWSPQGLGLTGGAGSGVSAADLISLPSNLSTAGGGGATASIGGSGGLTNSDKAAMFGNQGYGSGMSGAQTSVYDGLLDTTGSKGLADTVANSGVGSSLINGGKQLADMVGGGQNLAALVGAGLGATQGGKTETSSRDPWSAAQPYLKNLLADADLMRANLAANPFTPQQTQAYQNAYSGLDQARSALPGLLNWTQGAMQRQSTVPSYAAMFGGAQPAAVQPGPTMQAGGPGGLLGESPAIKNLMYRGKGLIG